MGVGSTPPLWIFSSKCNPVAYSLSNGRAGVDSSVINSEQQEAKETVKLKDPATLTRLWERILDQEVRVREVNTTQTYGTFFKARRRGFEFKQPATKVRKKIFGNPMTKIIFFYRRLDVFQVVHVIFLYCENLVTL